MALVVMPLWADQVELTNGDRYSGKILSLDTNSIVLQNEVVGTVTVPRSKVSAVHIGSVSVQPQLRLGTNLGYPVTRPTGTSPGATNLAGIGKTANAQIMEQVRSQYLSDAGPEANNKFDELAGGLLSGKLSVEDIRTEAKSVADQVRALKKDLGDDATSSLDAYLAILDKFIQETPPAPKPGTNSAPLNRATGQR